MDMRRWLLPAFLTALLLIVADKGWTPQAQSDSKTDRSKAAASDGARDPERKEPEKHFTPEIEKFIETFTPGGEGVDGAGNIPVPSPEESLRHCTVSNGLQMEVVATEPVIRQP